MVNKRAVKRKRPTMYDVAKLAGVSQPTVSRVLSTSDNPARISEKTSKRVLAAVEKLGYRPNVVARSLRTQRTQTIAMLIADLSNGFYQLMARAVQDVARQHDYEVLISNSDHLYENEKHFCEIVLARGVDGAILAPQHLTVEELDHYVSQTHIPFVVLGQHINHPNMDAVYVDDERATYEATRWLIYERGYRSFGYIGVPESLPPSRGRLRGFMRAMDEAGLSYESHILRDGDFTLESGKESAHTLLKRGAPPSALVVINDLMAIGVMLALQEAGYSIPNDVAVLGFDDITEATIVRPALTTIEQNPRDIGTMLAQALFERLENPNISGRRMFECPFRLIPRQST